MGLEAGKSKWMESICSFNGEGLIWLQLTVERMQAYLDET
jgi:hypothetical protein